MPTPGAAALAARRPQIIPAASSKRILLWIWYPRNEPIRIDEDPNQTYRFELVAQDGIFQLHILAHAYCARKELQ